MSNDSEGDTWQSRDKWKIQWEKTWNKNKQKKGIIFCFVFLQAGLDHYFMPVSDMDFDKEYSIIENISNEHIMCAIVYIENKRNYKTYISWNQ